MFISKYVNNNRRYYNARKNKNINRKFVKFQNVQIMKCHPKDYKSFENSVNFSILHLRANKIINVLVLTNDIKRIIELFESKIEHLEVIIKREGLKNATNSYLAENICFDVSFITVNTVRDIKNVIENCNCSVRINHTGYVIPKFARIHSNTFCINGILKNFI